MHALCEVVPYRSHAINSDSECHCLPARGSNEAILGSRSPSKVLALSLQPRSMTERKFYDRLFVEPESVRSDDAVHRTADIVREAM